MLKMVHYLQLIIVEQALWCDFLSLESKRFVVFSCQINLRVSLSISRGVGTPCIYLVSIDPNLIDLIESEWYGWLCILLSTNISWSYWWDVFSTLSFVVNCVWPWLYVVIWFLTLESILDCLMHFLSSISWLQTWKSLREQNSESCSTFSESGFLRALCLCFML